MNASFVQYLGDVAKVKLPGDAKQKINVVAVAKCLVKYPDFVDDALAEYNTRCPYEIICNQGLIDVL